MLRKRHFTPTLGGNLGTEKKRTSAYDICYRQGILSGCRHCYICRKVLWNKFSVILAPGISGEFLKIKETHNLPVHVELSSRDLSVKIHLLA